MNGASVSNRRYPTDGSASRVAVLSCMNAKGPDLVTGAVANRRSAGAVILLLVLFAVPLAAQNVQSLVGPPAATPLTGRELDRETVRVSALLRCPVCQGLSINDSPATMAVQMKQRTRELLAAGYSDEQILLYFEKSYGQFVRLDPPKSGINWIVWLAPALLFLGGLAIIVRRVARRRAITTPMAPPPVEVENDELAPWLAKVRAIAYGDETQ